MFRFTPRNMSFSRLVRFLPKDSPNVEPLIGEPVDRDVDIGLASLKGEDIEVSLFSGSSVLAAGEKTGKTALLGRVLSPLAAREVGTIRCIGLNYVNHAREVNMDIPNTPTVFFKPNTALANPFPDPVIIPRAVVKDEAADYESELAMVLGKECKNVSENNAMDYVLGYTAANDISSRVSQFAQSQWCHSKSFDGACPIGPALLHKNQIKDIGNVSIRGELNGHVVQESKLDDLIFSVPKIVSFLSQGTTLPAGTVIITGTPAGVGWSRQPKLLLKDGDEFRVHISHGVGTLVNKIENEAE